MSTTYYYKPDQHYRSYGFIHSSFSSYDKGTRIADKAMNFLLYSKRSFADPTPDLAITKKIEDDTAQIVELGNAKCKDDGEVVIYLKFVLNSPGTIFTDDGRKSIDGEQLVFIDCNGRIFLPTSQNDYEYTVLQQLLC